MAKKGDGRRDNAMRHGLRSRFVTKGDPSSLTPAQSGRLAELRTELETRDGIQQALREQAARALLISEMAVAQLRTELEDGHTMADAPVLRRLGTFMESARRHISALAEHTAEDDKMMLAEKAKVIEMATNAAGKNAR